MTTSRPTNSRRGPDSTAMVWSVIFGLVAFTGLWRATGHAINWGLVTLAAPVILVALGVLGLVLSRTNTPPQQKGTPQ